MSSFVPETSKNAPAPGSLASSQPFPPLVTQPAQLAPSLPIVSLGGRSSAIIDIRDDCDEVEVEFDPAYEGDDNVLELESQPVPPTNNATKTAIDSSVVIKIDDSSDDDLNALENRRCTIERRRVDLSIYQVTNPSKRTQNVQDFIHRHRVLFGTDKVAAARVQNNFNSRQLLTNMRTHLGSHDMTPAGLDAVVNPDGWLSDLHLDLVAGIGLKGGYHVTGRDRLLSCYAFSALVFQVSDPSAFAKDVHQLLSPSFSLFAGRKTLLTCSYLSQIRISDIRQIFFSHCHRNHWKLVVVDHRERTISAYDSMAEDVETSRRRGEQAIKVGSILPFVMANNADGLASVPSGCRQVPRCSCGWPLQSVRRS